MTKTFLIHLICCHENIEMPIDELKFSQAMEEKDLIKGDGFFWHFDCWKKRLTKIYSPP